MQFFRNSRHAALKSALAVSFAAAALLTLPGLASAENTYSVDYLISNQPGAAFQDPKLRNAWGFAWQPHNFLWINQNRSGAAGLYAGDGSLAGVEVNIPRPPPPRRPDIGLKSAPTGMVASQGNDFFVDNDPAWPAKFIFATEDGTIAAWYDGEGTDMTLQINHSRNGAHCTPPQETCQGAVYKGLALAVNPVEGRLLYATNFRSGKIEVYDSAWQSVDLGPTAFTDAQIPAGYAPYNIVSLSRVLYVTYAKQDETKHDSVSCRRCGYVNVFNTEGKLLRRLVPQLRNQQLNAPYGVAIAPESFWPGGAVLIGNFGNGKINAYSKTGMWLGTLLEVNTGKLVTLPGLWQISFPGTRGFGGSDASKLYFTSGPAGEANGRFGTLTLNNN